MVGDIESVYKAIGVIVVATLLGEQCVSRYIFELHSVHEVGPLCVVVLGA